MQLTCPSVVSLVCAALQQCEQQHGAPGLRLFGGSSAKSFPSSCAWTVEEQVHKLANGDYRAHAWHGGSSGEKQNEAAIAAKSTKLAPRLGEPRTYGVLDCFGSRVWLLRAPFDLGPEGDEGKTEAGEALQRLEAAAELGRTGHERIQAPVVELSERVQVNQRGALRPRLRATQRRTRKTWISRNLLRRWAGRSTEAWAQKREGLQA